MPLYTLPVLPTACFDLFPRDGKGSAAGSRDFAARDGVTADPSAVANTTESGETEFNMDAIDLSDMKVVGELFVCLIVWFLFYWFIVWLLDHTLTFQVISHSLPLTLAWDTGGRVNRTLLRS